MARILHTVEVSVEIESLTLPDLLRPTKILENEQHHKAYKTNRTYFSMLRCFGLCSCADIITIYQSIARDGIERHGRPIGSHLQSL